MPFSFQRHPRLRVSAVRALRSEDPKRWVAFLEFALRHPKVVFDDPELCHILMVEQPFVDLPGALSDLDDWLRAIAAGHRGPDKEDGKLLRGCLAGCLGAAARLAARTGPLADRQDAWAEALADEVAALIKALAAPADGADRARAALALIATGRAVFAQIADQGYAAASARARVAMKELFVTHTEVWMKAFYRHYRATLVKAHGGWTEGEDIVQEALGLRLSRLLKVFDPARGPLLALTRRHAGFCAREGQSRSRLDKAREANFAQDVRAVSARAPDQDARLRLRDYVRYGQTLPESRRDVLDLKAAEELKRRKVAWPSDLRVRLHHARRQVQELIKEEEE